MPSGGAANGGRLRGGRAGSALGIRDIRHQGKEGAVAGGVGGAGIELESSAKQSACLEASRCQPLAFCCLSSSVSFSIYSVSLSICFVRFSLS